MDTPSCCICMEEESEDLPFLTKELCDCSKKKDSTIKIHQICLELARNTENQCPMCKTDLTNDWAFDARFKQTADPDFNQFNMLNAEGERHGPGYMLELTHNDSGPVRFLAGKCSWRNGLQHGLNQLMTRDGNAVHESTYKDGKLDGVVREYAKGELIGEKHYKEGVPHGLNRHLQRGIWIGGIEIDGKRQGEYTELSYGQYMRGNYTDGKKDGRFQTFSFYDDALVEEAHYRMDEKHGLQRRWSDGKLVFEANVSGGKLHGKLESWNQEGRTIELQYYFEGVPHGIHMALTVNGRVEKTYSMGVLHGRIRRWIDEELIMDAHYEGGLRTGVHMDAIGRWKVRAGYTIKDGEELRHGPYEATRLYTGKRIVAHYENGVLHGPKKIYLGNRLLFSVAYYEGKLHGTCRAYTSKYDDSTYWPRRTGEMYLCAEANFYHGTAHGSFVRYNQFGDIIESGCYKYGQLHGAIVYNDEDGWPQQRLTYYYGKLRGGQRIYEDGRLSLSFTVRDGRIHGAMRSYDERQAITESWIEDADVRDFCRLRQPAALVHCAHPEFAEQWEE